MAGQLTALVHLDLVTTDGQILAEKFAASTDPGTARRLYGSLVREKIEAALEGQQVVAQAPLYDPDGERQIAALRMTFSLRRSMAQIRQDIPPFSMVDGQPARVFGMNIRGMQRRGIDKENRQALKVCYRLILQSGLNLTQAINSIKASVAQTETVQHLVRFLESPSKMGVCIREPDHRRERRQKAQPLKVEAAN